METFQPKLRFQNFEDKWTEDIIKNLVSRYINPVKVDSNREYQQIGIRSHGKGLFHKDFVTGDSLGNKRVFWIIENALIINIVFAWEQAVAKTTDKEIGMIASHRFPMYLPLENKSNIDFLNYFFLTKKGKFLLENASPGGAGRNKTLGQKEFDNSKIIIPSILEQTKIANFLSSVDEKLNLLKEKKELLLEYKKGIMQKIFNQEIRFKDDNGNYFANWVEKSLGEIGNTFNGLTGKTKENFGIGGKPYIQYKQIFDNSKIDIEKCELVEITEKDNQNSVQYGDVFFTVSSETPNEIGTASVLLDKVKEMYLNSFCFGYRPNSLTELVPEFSRYLFRNELFRNEIIKLAQGSTRYNMSKVSLMKLFVSLPQAEEQIKIANFLSAIDQKIELVSNQIQDTQEYKKGLLQQMFV